MHGPRLLVRSAAILPTLLAAACVGPHGSAAGTAEDASLTAATLEPTRPAIRVRVGGGPLSPVIAHPAAGKATLHVSFPEAFHGCRVLLRIDREPAGGEPWLRFTPRVPDDGTLEVAGIEPGRYRLCAELAGKGALQGAVEAVPGAVPVDMAAR